MQVKKELKKKNYFYFLILCLWFLALGIIWYNYYLNLINNLGTVATIILTVNFIIISYYVFFAIRDFMVWSLNFFLDKIGDKTIKNVENVILSEEDMQKKVLLLYPSYNDFIPEAVLNCMKQNYQNFEIIILDDSSKIEEKRKIDKFAKKYNLRVVRRENRIGYKAGNMNNFLQKNKDYDYFVLLDSDEILSPNFIVDCLKYFKYFSNIGVVQANHMATKSKNHFVKKLSYSFNYKKQFFEHFKNRFGKVLCYGHGAMISKECYEKIEGGFPHVFADDWSFSMEARKNNFMTIFAPNIVCKEDLPINLPSYKKRQFRWTRGQIQFIKRYFFKVMFNKMNLKFCEKVDVLFQAFLAPLGAIAIINIINFTFLFDFLDIKFVFHWGFIVLVTFCFFTIFISDIYFGLRKHNNWNLRKIFVSVFHYFIIGFTTSFMMFWSLFTFLLGKKSKFIVTDKFDTKIKFYKLFTSNWKELVFASTLLTLSLTLNGSGNIVNSLLWLFPFFLSPYLTWLSNIKCKDYKTNLESEIVYNYVEIKNKK